MRRRAVAAAATALVLVAFTALTLNATLTLRPLPTIDGHFRFLGLLERAEVGRDGFGVPRIEANNAHDLFFLQGYVTAQDRFAQMEALRTSPQVRALFVSAAAALEPGVGEALAAYAAGVTKWIEQHSEDGALPMEIALQGHPTEPWTAGHTRAIIAVYLGSSARSSCLVLGGDRSLRGAPLLAADLDADLPDPGWYEIGLVAPDLRAVGISLPGVPGLVAGHNGSVAWSLHASEGRWGDVIDAEARLISGLRARDLQAFMGRAPELSVFAGCVADDAGKVGALTPYREVSAGELLIAGGIGATAELLRRVPSLDADVEGLRLVLGARRAERPAARIVIDLGDLDATKAALSTGQSGHPAARHYGDQRQLWAAGQLHRLAWTRERIARVEGVLVLRPR